MFPRKPLADWQELAQPGVGAGVGAAVGFARRSGLWQPVVMVGATLSPAWFDQTCYPSPRRLPGPLRVGRFCAGRTQRGQSPADAGDLPFRGAAHAVRSGRIQPHVRGRFPCSSPFLFLPLRHRPLRAAGRPTSSVASLVPPPVRSSLILWAAMRWPVRPQAALPVRCATTSTSASNPVGLIDSTLSMGPRLHPQGWSLLLRHGAAGEGPCSRKS